MIWRPVDVIVLILAGALGTALALTAVIPFLTGQPPTDARSKLITGVISAMITVISVYVGARMQAAKGNGGNGGKEGPPHKGD